MIGFIVAITKVDAQAGACSTRMPGTVPDRLLQKNIDAFEKGYAIGIEQLPA